MSGSKSGAPAGAPASPAGPSIRILLRRGAGPVLEDRRPPILRALIGRRAADALAMVPLLLPICGAAQRIAATRAVEAADERPATATTERWRDVGLCAEQAVSIAWRLAVDWPPLVGAPPDVATVKRVRDALAPLRAAAEAGEAGAAPDDGALGPAAGEAAALLAGLAGPAAAEGLDQLLAALPEHPSAAAAVLRRAHAAPAGLGAHRGRLLGPDALAERLAPLLAPLLSDPSADPIAALSGRLGAPLEVGPLAAANDPLTTEARERFGAGAFARLLAGARAALQWPAAFQRALAGEAVLRPLRAGVGAAMTARGPVLHGVALNGAGETAAIAAWRVVAPTDWHFVAGGPVLDSFQKPLTIDLTQSQAALCVASFDPCAPCAVETDADA